MTRFVFVVCCLLVSGCAFIDDFSRFEVDPNRADAGDAGTPPDARVIDAPGCVARPETCNVRVLRPRPAARRAPCDGSPSARRARWRVAHSGRSGFAVGTVAA